MGGLSPQERECVARASAEPMIDQVLDWAAINSGSRNLDGLERMAERLSGAFSVLPGTLDLVDAEPKQSLDPAGMPMQETFGRHLHLSVRPGAPVQLLFTGHMDTVYGADHPFQQCRWLDGERVNGPGVADMKGGLAVMLAALKAIEGAPGAADIGYDVLINSDEEVGSPGSAALLARLAGGKKAALTYEPAALPDGTLAGARPGSGNFAFAVRGRSAHAGRNPQDGRNAVAAAAALALEVEKLRTARIKVNVARMDGGGPNNVVPDLAILHVNIRPALPEDQAAAEAALARIVATVARERDVVIEPHGGFARPPKPMTRQAEALFATVQAAGADLGQQIGWIDTGGVCDGNNIAACGVPVIDTMGVRGGSIHSAEEYLIVPSLAERAALSALSILRIAGDAR